jgi:hypothetical protein
MVDDAVMAAVPQSQQMVKNDSQDRSRNELGMVSDMR